MSSDNRDGFVFFVRVLYSLWPFSVITVLPGHDAKEVALHIAGLFPINGAGGWQGGQAAKPAANMALADVNGRTDLLPGYRLEMHWNDSECEVGLGAAAMFDLLYNEPVKLMLLAGCSSICSTVAEPAKLYNLVALCYGAGNPALADRSRFSTLFRTHPNAISLNPSRIVLMKKFGWKRIAFLYQVEEDFFRTSENLEEECKAEEIEIFTRVSFLSNPTEAIRSLKRQDARIIVGLFYVAAARKVLCEAYKMKMYGRQYVWIFMGSYENEWYETNLDLENVNCTKNEMRLAAEGHLTVEALMWNPDNRKTVSGMTSEDFRNRFNDDLKGHGYDIDSRRFPEGYQEAPLAYDAIWAVALAFNRTIPRLAKKGILLENFEYNNTEIKNEIYNAMDATEFMGVSGKVTFSSKGDRIAWTQIEQLQTGKYKLLGYYNAEMRNMTWFQSEEWIGGKVPQDRTYIRRDVRGTSNSLLVAMSTTASVGIFWAIILIIFNYAFRDRKVILQSNPGTNNLMLIGFVLCFTYIFLIGLDGQFIPVSAFSAMCTFRKWVLSMGFTIAYGALFSKVWTVHRKTTKYDAATKHKIQPWKLYSLMAIVVGFEIIFLMVWTLVDPLQRKIELFDLEDPDLTLNDDDYKILPFLEHCESTHHNIWLGVTYGVKGILLALGVLLAYETRSITSHYFNDSRLVALAIYNVAILCFITTPVTMVISSKQDAFFAFVSLAIIFTSMITMGLIFIPKIIEVVRAGNENLGHSTAQDDAETKNEEEEKRYQKLLSENDTLKNILEQMEDRLKLLKVKLEKVSAMRLRVKDEEEVEADTVSEPPRRAYSDHLSSEGLAGDGSGINDNIEHVEVLQIS